MNRILTEAVFCLNPSDANDSTYHTWCHVRLMTDGTLERCTNGGQKRFEVFGYVSANETQLFTTNANETQAARILAHFAAKAERKCNVSGFGAAWSNVTWEAPTINEDTGRKLTAFTSIRDGEPQRNRNLDNMRRKVGGGFTRRDGSVNPLLDAAEKRNAKATNVKRNTVIRINPSTMRITR